MPNEPRHVNVPWHSELQTSKARYATYRPALSGIIYCSHDLSLGTAAIGIYLVLTTCIMHSLGAALIFDMDCVGIMGL